jgi:hypothetical protein
MERGLSPLFPVLCILPFFLHLPSFHVQAVLLLPIGFQGFCFALSPASLNEFNKLMALCIWSPRTHMLNIKALRFLLSDSM